MQCYKFMKYIDLTGKRMLQNKKLLSHMNMGKEILTIGDIEIEKINFTAIKVLFSRRCTY